MGWLIFIWVVSVILGVFLRSTKGFVLALFLGPLGFLISLLFESSGQKLYNQLTTLDFVELKGDGSFSFEIVGESFYQKNIMKELSLSGGKSSKSFRVRLIYDSKNPHDSNAIAVYIGLSQVGHLSKREAVSYRVMMSELGLENQPAVCDATVVGGGEKKYYGIYLDFDIAKTKRLLGTKSTSQDGL